MVDLSYALKLPPEKAIDYLKSKGYKISWDWWEVWQSAHARVFTVAKVMSLEILQDIHKALVEALQEGKTFQEFKKELIPILQQKGWWGRKEIDGKKVELGSPRRLETIFRTNIQTAYMAGRYKTLIEDVDNRPYWQYVAVLDKKTRPSHEALHGKIFKYDDPFWDHFFPPNGFNCRCRVRALDEKEIKKKGLKVESSEGKISQKYVLISKKSQETKPVAVYQDETNRVETDPGWNYNPGKVFYEPDLSKYPQELKSMYAKELERYTPPGLVHELDLSFEHPKDVHKLLLRFSEVFPEFFPRGFGGVSWEEGGKRYFMRAYRGQFEGIIGISDHTFPSGYNPMRHLLSALKKIKEKQPLEFLEEHAIKSLFHELLHHRVKKPIRFVNDYDIGAVEIAVEFCARRMYDKLLRILGGKARHQEKMILEAYSYSGAMKDFHKMLQDLKIDDKKILKEVDKLIYETEERTFARLATLLAKASGRPEVGIYNRLDEIIRKYWTD